MEWIRIKPQHILNTQLTKTEKCALIEMQLLTASLERLPTERELLQLTTKKTLTSIENYLKLNQICIEFILKKVMEDVKKYQQKKEKDKEKMALWREKKHVVTSNVTSNVTSSVTSNVTVKDKIREDNIHTISQFTTPQAHVVSYLASLYQKETGSLFQSSKKDFVVATQLCAKHGVKPIISKIDTFFEMCKNKSMWFTKDGMADFNIGKLSSQWNSIIATKSATTSPKIAPEVQKQLDAIIASKGKPNGI